VGLRHEVKSLPIECRELQMHCFPYWDAHLYRYLHAQALELTG
jgi:hypothetical protein